MNLWECEYPGCRNTAVGCGSAVGLRAIGWTFGLGPVILCPIHSGIAYEQSEMNARSFQNLIQQVCDAKPKLKNGEQS